MVAIRILEKLWKIFLKDKQVCITMSEIGHLRPQPITAIPSKCCRPSCLYVHSDAVECVLIFNKRCCCRGAVQRSSLEYNDQEKQPQNELETNECNVSKLSRAPRQTEKFRNGNVWWTILVVFEMMRWISVHLGSVFLLFFLWQHAVVFVFILKWVINALLEMVKISQNFIKIDYTCLVPGKFWRGRGKGCKSKKSFDHPKRRWTIS